MAEPRRLRGHKATATCCIASRDRPGLVATSGEDGCVCWFNMRCKEVLFAMYVGDNPISSLCFKIACNSRSCFLSAADDGDDVKIIDIRQQCLYKTLRGGHRSICSSVQFVPWRPWEVITGGLDSKLVMWDFSKGRPYKVVDFSVPDPNGGCSAGQSLNPSFVHAIVVPDVDMVDKLGKICVVARGDGVVEVIDIESEFASIKSKKFLEPHKGAQSRPKGNASSAETETQDQNERKKLCLDYSLGGHTASASCVAFSMFGERGKYIISAGNDKSVKVWDWSTHFYDVQTSSNSDLMHLNIKLKKKVNWLCTTPTDSENLIVCDTSKAVKVYTVS